MTEFQEEEYNNRFDFKIWKDIFKYTSNCKGALIIMFINMVILALGDTLFPLFIGYAIDKYVIEKDISNIYIFGSLFLLLIIIECITVYIFIKLAGVIEASIQKDIREAGFINMQKLSFSYYDTTPIGWIMARMGSDVTKLGSLIAWGLVDFIWGIFMVMFLIIAMVLLNLKLALIIIATIPVIAFIGYYFQIKILNGHRVARKINSKITAQFSEGINGAKTTKTLVREDGSIEEFSVLTNDMRLKSIRVHILSSIFLPLVTFSGAIATIFILTEGSMEVLKTSITIGTLTAFISYSTKLFEPITQIARIFSEMQSAQASGERILSLINTKPDIVENEEVQNKYGDIFNKKTENFEVIKGNIEFKNVTFKYETGETVLKNFNLKVKSGEKIALVGATGSGKSTIINLLCRFYEPTEGQIFIDDVDYKKRSQSWLHSNLSYVLQSPHLFSGSIKENVRYGNLNATDEEIIQACKKVNAYEFINKFEKGIDTDVGEGGDRLSQGEKQLVSFARAIIGKPKLFILDEATSSIDTITEMKIQDAIDKALDGITSFIIAHRLSTIKNADRILVINKGKVIEDGSHDELMKNKSNYYELYMKQFKEDEFDKLVGKK